MESQSALGCLSWALSQRWSERKTTIWNSSSLRVEEPQAQGWCLPRQRKCFLCFEFHMERAAGKQVSMSHGLKWNHMKKARTRSIRSLRFFSICCGGSRLIRSKAQSSCWSLCGGRKEMPESFLPIPRTTSGYCMTGILRPKEPLPGLQEPTAWREAVRVQAVHTPIPEHPLCTVQQSLPQCFCSVDLAGAGALW
jgi:hypothetical protein